MQATDMQPVAVVGVGLAGLAAAVALADAGVPVALIGPTPTSAELARDTRTTALFGGSIELLRHVGVWPALADWATPLVRLRLVDDAGGLIRAPEVLFEAAELGLAAFGYNIENAVLLQSLSDLVSTMPGIRRHAAMATAIEAGADAVTIGLDDGSRVAARLVVAADGARSSCRAAAGIAVRTWDYPQVAIATRFRHARPHDGVSTEFHRRPGPLTTVPLAGRSSSLVWVETPDEAHRLQALDGAAFGKALEVRLQGVLGAVGEVGPRALFPLTGLTAHPLGQRRVALVGEAGHRLPPIGAQGLNLGLRDIAWLVDLVGEASRAGQDPGSDGLLAAYDRARRSDVDTRTFAVDALNRSLISDLLPLDAARSLGLAALAGLPWLRRFFMAQGMSPGGRLPALLAPPRETSP